MRINFKFFFIIFIAFYFVFLDEVYAISFKKGSGVCYNDNFGNFSVQGDSSCARVRDYVKKTKDDNYAFCGNRTLHYAGNTASYKRSKSWESDKQCIYYTPYNATVTEDGKTITKVKWKKHTNGDCSSVVGFILHEGLQHGSTATEKWFWAQTSLWTYFGKYGKSGSGADYSRYNTSAKKAWKNNSTIKGIIRNAWKNYSKVHSTVNNLKKDDVNFSVDILDNDGNVTNDYSLHYIPNNACGTGSYQSNNIRITNNESTPITVKIPLTFDNVSLCKHNNSSSDSCYKYGSDDDEVLTVRLGAGESMIVYLKTSYVLNSNIDLSIEATYKDNEEYSFTLYDTKRYEKSNYQSMHVLEKIDENGTVKVVHESEKSISLSQTPITHFKCGSQSVSGYSTKNTSSSAVAKVCANNVTDVSNTDAYTAKFSGCNCTSIDLGNGRKVRILLYEKVSFRYGSLTPEPVYPGGGFAFATSENGISTSYISKISWDFADYYGPKSNNIPYYYNPNNLSSYNANTVEIKGLIERALRNKLNNGVTIKFGTRDSNDHNNVSVVTVPLEISMNANNLSYDSTKKMFTYIGDNISMNPAYFSSSGVVSYERNDAKYPVSGGNKYYIPMKYDGNSFPYDILPSNLSILESGNFWIKADCDIDVFDYYLNSELRYRPIDVSNPFPKNSIPSNWVSWWQNAANKARLNNTYQNYPNSPLYSITLNDVKMSRINSISSVYTNWDTVSRDGTNTFVTRTSGFDKYASRQSYCELGRFSSSCDR